MEIYKLDLQFFNDEEVKEEEAPEAEEAATEEVVEETAEETTEEVKEETEAPAEEEAAEETPAEESAEEASEETSTEEASEEATEEKAEEPKKVSGAAKFVATEDQMPGSYDPFARPVNPRFANRPQREPEFEERILEIKRVIKVTKGGRRFKFSALVVIGDKNGRVGYGIGKHIEVPEAIKKAIKEAKKNMYDVKIVGTQKTVPHSVIGTHGSSKVMLKPANEGKGIIASDKVRAVVELAGYENIYTKSLGSNSATNIIQATIEGLQSMRTKEQVEKIRGKEIK